jgi:hypothetical protein
MAVAEWAGVSMVVADLVVDMVVAAAIAKNINFDSALPRCSGSTGTGFRISNFGL